AEMVAALYDASLDAYLPHQWMRHFSVFRQDHTRLNSEFENAPRYLNNVVGWWQVPQKDLGPLTYRAFPPDVTVNLWGFQYGYARGMGGFGGGGMAPGAPPPMSPAPAALE